MKFVRFERNGTAHMAVEKDGALHGLPVTDKAFPGTLDELVGDAAALEAAGKTLAAAPALSGEGIRYLPPFERSSKILCVGLNYSDHTEESGYAQPEYPTIFARFASGVIAHEDPIVRPAISETLDYEGELVAVIGKPAFKVSEEAALDYVAGYSIFNDGSVREFQHVTPQWTIGKNFDNTGAFGPSFVTAGDLPKGALGLTLETRLNGEVVQSAKIDQMVFSVAKLISILSQSMTLLPGDLIVTGTPSGIGAARKPPLWMKAGDICEVEIEGIGVLRNRIEDEATESADAA
ncbi:fumarylacetoacetate hydrolase family protein [Celeribacter sp.]|uniref:fumarylacetoacetate hydrolase family protein n=1 Tax=Celeribacter sp. TaxID=1890673 RepID=UPI003A934361